MRFTRLFIFMSILVGSNCLAQSETLVKTKIDHVTVYLNGASVARTQALSLASGRNSFRIEGLSGKLDPKSLHISLAGAAKLVSFYFEKDLVLKEDDRSALSVWEDSLQHSEYTLKKLQYEQEAYATEKQLLVDNVGRIGEKDGVKTTELSAATTYYRNKIREVNFKLLDFERQLKPLQQKIARLHEKLTTFHNEQSQLECYRLIFIVESSAAASSELSIRYFVKDVGWAPKYDLRTKGVGFPIELDYRAQLFNLSGEDWPNVPLTLSTAMPSTTMEKPKMDVWGLHYSNQYSYQNNDKEGLLNKRVMRKDMLSSKQEESSKTQLSQVEINISDISVDFKIKDKYTIPSDGRPHVVDVSAYTLNASYHYFSIPKVAQEVYLIGKITGWEQLNLLEGNANTYLDGTFVGQSFIDTRYSNDTLEIVLGVDKKVNIQRVKRMDHNQKNLIGMNRKESLAYEINVRNMHASPIDIEIQDQLPVAQEGDIAVEAEEISGADKDDLSGRLKWRFSLDPSKTKTLNISFSVKYPRNKNLSLRPSRRAALNCPSDFW